VAARRAEDLGAALDAFVAAATRQRAAAAAAHEGLTANDLLALSHVQQADSVRPAQLAQRLLLTAGGTAGVIRRLVAAGLVERSAAPANHRDVRLRVTPDGRALLAAQAAERDAELNRTAPRLRGEMVALLSRLTVLAERRADATAEHVAQAIDPARGVPSPVLWG